MIPSELNEATNKVSPAQSLHKRTKYTSNSESDQRAAELAENGAFLRPSPPENEDEDDTIKSYQSDESAQFLSNAPAEHDLVEGQARQAAVLMPTQTSKSHIFVILHDNIVFANERSITPLMSSSQVNEKIQEMRKLKASIISEIKENTRVFSDNLNQVLTTVRTQQVTLQLFYTHITKIATSGTEELKVNLSLHLRTSQLTTWSANLKVLSLELCNKQ